MAIMKKSLVWFGVGMVRGALRSEDSASRLDGGQADRESEIVTMSVLCIHANSLRLTRMKFRLQTPGPTPVPEETLLEMAKTVP